MLKKKPVDLLDQHISSIISEGCEVEGNIKAKAYVRIDGVVNGDVTIEQGLIMGDKSIINGNVKTKEAVVFGTINGNLHVDSLEVKATGKINGEINTRLLQMEPGARYNGKVVMPEDSPKSTKE